jgi:hypothetical protein
MLDALIRHTSVLEIVGDIIRVRATDAALGDLAVVENTDGEVSSASVVELNREIASLQVFAGGKGISTLPGLGRAHRWEATPDRRPDHPGGGPHSEPHDAGHAVEDDRDGSPYDRSLQQPGGESEDPDLLGGG